MKISEIRDIIGNAEWSRHDLTGGTAEEFRRQDVGPRLEAKIAELQALVIPPRFVDDEARRVKEIEHCQRVIDRWNKAQEVPGEVNYETNTEMLTRLMDRSRNGALMQAFVLTAIQKYSAQCIEVGAATFDSGFMDGRAWIRCAEEAGRNIDTHLTPKK